MFVLSENHHQKAPATVLYSSYGRPRGMVPFVSSTDNSTVLGKIMDAGFVLENKGIYATTFFEV